ncbi:MAG TPA: LOG family protein [Anaerolineales bacterium]|nr:LOG family protein [Anaerolineales bacterium]
MNITIFGGSQPKPGSPAYIQAYELGKLLAQAGHTILTGGYMGTMEAASRGANEAGGHVIGVTCADIEAWRGAHANAWVKEERRFATLQERLNELIRACDAAIALPGGPGTLTEIALTWNLMIVDSLPRKPLIVVGEGWKKTLSVFLQEFAGYTYGEQEKMIIFAGTIQEASERVSG